MSSAEHVPVMMAEVLETLPLRPGATVVDGTLGLAGHALEMGRRIAPGGLLVGLDWDDAMLARAGERLKELDGVTVVLRRSDYRFLRAELERTCIEAGRAPFADAALLDLGLNNAQIMDPSRGISFQTEGPLDMRMDKRKGESAAMLLNRMTAREIEDVLFEYGGERWARKIAQVIVERRKSQPLKTTADLVDCILAAIPAAKRDKRIHPATRSFQAIRIFVNDELEGLTEAVTDAAMALAAQGVLVVLSYHSGEDRAVKTAFRDLAKTEAFEVLTKKPLVPTAEEVSANPKARSAKFRAIRRLTLETA